MATNIVKMAKIEIIHQHLQSVEQSVLDIYQLKIISMYEELANEKNIFEYLFALNTNGYLLGLEIKEEKVRFRACDPELISRNYGWTIEGQFQGGLIFFVRKLLTDWHAGVSYQKKQWSSSFGIENKDFSFVRIRLTRRQRGILTKILKLEKKRRLSVRSY